MPPSNLNIYISNRLEILAEQLASILRQPSPSPMSPEIVVVQSQGMQRWISLELAAHNGICANVNFPFPNTFLEYIFGKLAVDLPPLSPFDPDVLVFRIMKILPTCADRNGFENLKSYLSDDPFHLKLFQLSSKIADIFDQYLIFRPEMILDWEADRSELDPTAIWQATLWRELVKNQPLPHRAQLQQTILEKIQQSSTPSLYLPDRVAVFGVSYLPVFHLITLAELSKLMHINFFLLNPCREYWADISSEKEIKRIRKKFSLAEEPAEFLHLEQGNRLLASMGTLGRNFFALINNLDIESHEYYVDPPIINMLTCIQSDILNLRDRNDTVPASDAALEMPAAFSNTDISGPLELPLSDRSVQIHACHSPMREVEVLFDNVLAMFEDDPELQPKDIVVMAPDIELYAPYIHAVFGAQTDQNLRIPYSIADQNARRESRLIDGFLAFLDLSGSRFSSAQVIGLMAFPAVRSKFNLDDSDEAKIERWVKDTRIRWGIDENMRTGFGLPGYPENTWRFGLERLLLGSAMPGCGEHMFNGILPYDHVEGSDVKVLGKFLDFTERVFKLADILDQPKRLTDWRHTFISIIGQFFQADAETERELQTLRLILDQLVSREELSGFEEPLEIEVVKSYLKGHLERHNFGSGFITGGVTFCAMLPMRSIPFGVVSLIGMNIDAFPRDAQPLTFDLIAKYPKIGDRSSRNDDKYLFLEALLSARKIFYISYIGQSVQDNARVPPSVLVEELLESVATSFAVPEHDILEHVVTHHRLQAFSPAYFQEDSRLFSYSEENMIAGTRMQEPAALKPFIIEKLPIVHDEVEIWQQIDLDSLCLFYANPARFLLKQRLGIQLDHETHMGDENENFELNHLEKYFIGEEFIRKQLDGFDLRNLKQIQKAAGILPHGSPGEFQFDHICTDVEGFARKIESVAGNHPAESIDVAIALSGYKLFGRLTGIYNDGVVHYRYARTKGRDLMRTWIYHLAYCHNNPSCGNENSILVTKDTIWKFDPVVEPLQVFGQLLDVYWQGLLEPIHFFPESAWAYIQKLQKNPDFKQGALNQAKSKWFGNDFAKGEGREPNYQLCFGSDDPIDEKFQKLALQVLGPLIHHCQEIKV